MEDNLKIWKYEYLRNRTLDFIEFATKAQWTKPNITET